MAQPTQEKKDRGILLVILVLLGLAGVELTLLRGVGAFIDRTVTGNLKYLSIAYDWYIFVASIVLLIAIFGMWNWKRWGVYLLITVALFGFLRSLAFYFDSRYIFNWYVELDWYVRLVGWMVLWPWAIRRKWKYFE